ncbi:MAG: APC family permease [Verrucomicrobiota bacterium JB025]|nr:amino acid permease [Verrucomicrobiota bacterium JB025]
MTRPVPPHPTARPAKALSLFDSTNIIVGIIIGVGIYRMAPEVAQGAHSGTGVLLLWTLGGLISLCGALGYAELASAWPRHGGDLVYLSKAYGDRAGFLFGWAQLTIIRPGDIAVMAFAFVTYGLPLLGLPPEAESGWSGRLLAAAAVAVLTAINMLGVREGKFTQNLLTTLKLLGLAAIILIAFLGPGPATTPSATGTAIPWSLALVFVLFTYGGWNEMAYVAAEVKNPDRNILRALVIGTLAVTILYLAVNAAFLHRLGFEGLKQSTTPAVDSVEPLLHQGGGRVIAALVCLSALGAINGLVFTGARISFAMGETFPVMNALGRWNPATGTPVRALLVQGLLAIALILLLGSLIDTLVYTAAVVYTFYFATSAAVFVLRKKHPHTPRPYRVTAFPVPTLVFMAVCAYLIHSCVSYSLDFRPASIPVIITIIAAGLIIHQASGKTKRTRPD